MKKIIFGLVAALAFATFSTQTQASSMALATTAVAIAPGPCPPVCDGQIDLPAMITAEEAYQYTSTIATPALSGTPVIVKAFAVNTEQVGVMNQLSMNPAVQGFRIYRTSGDTNIVVAINSAGTDLPANGVYVTHASPGPCPDFCDTDSPIYNMTDTAVSPGASNIKAFAITLEQLNTMNQISGLSPVIAGYRVYPTDFGSDMVVGINGAGSDLLIPNGLKMTPSSPGPCPWVCDTESPIFSGSAN